MLREGSLVATEVSFELVAVRINERQPKDREERRWAVIRNAEHLARLIVDLIRAAEDLPEGARGLEILQAASDGRVSPELEVAWVVTEVLQTKEIEIRHVKSVDAWRIKSRPWKLVISVETHRTQVKHERRRAKERVGPTVR